MRRRVQAVMCAHDQVAERNFVTSLPEIPHEVDEDDDAAVKIIQLVKSFTEPLVGIFTSFIKLYAFTRNSDIN